MHNTLKFLGLFIVGLQAGTCQIEATSSSTGILVSEMLLYKGRLLKAELPRAAVLDILGTGTRTLQKPKQTTSLMLTKEQERVAELEYKLEMLEARRRLQADQPIRQDTAMSRLASATTRLMVRRCGSCWIELLEKKIAHNEAIRVSLVGPDPQHLTVAAITLDKRRNAYADLFDKPWTGVREIYLIDQVHRITQTGGVLKNEKVDIQTGKPTGEVSGPPGL